MLTYAQEEARLLGHGFIGTEHILLGLLHEGEGLGAKALESLGISLEAVREKVEETIGPAGSAPTGSPPFTPRAKKVLELSLREALQLGHNYIGTEHLVLGLVREGNGVAAQVLRSLGADLPARPPAGDPAPLRLPEPRDRRADRRGGTALPELLGPARGASAARFAAAPGRRVPCPPTRRDRSIRRRGRPQRRASRMPRPPGVPAAPQPRARDRSTSSSSTARGADPHSRTCAEPRGREKGRRPRAPASRTAHSARTVRAFSPYRQAATPP